LKRPLLVLGLCFTCLSLWPLAAQAGAPSHVVDSYCSPSGDYCTSISRSAKGELVFSLRTFALTFKESFFYKGPGNYRVSWWFGDGKVLGPRSCS
jgi:hypothetical protein